MKRKLLYVLPLVTSISYAQTWDEHVYQGIDQRLRGNFASAAQHFERAANLKENGNSQEYWDACIQYARAEMVDSAFALLDQAIDAGMVDLQKVKEKSRIEILHNDPRWDKSIAKMRQAEEEYRSNLSHPKLRDALKNLWRDDQRLVGQWEEQKQVISRNTIKLKELIDQFGWPTIPMVGRDGSWTAWAIAQHSFDIYFQRECLLLIADAVSLEEADPSIYAELQDRICRNTNLKQIFGMATTEKEGKRGFYPIAEEWKVDIRRTSIGLPPLKVFANLNHISYQIPTKEEANLRGGKEVTEAQQLYESAIRSLEEDEWEKAENQLDQALESHGDIDHLQIYDFCIILAQVPGLDAATATTIFAYLKSLEKWEARTLILLDKRLDRLRTFEGWEELKSDLVKGS